MQTIAFFIVIGLMGIVGIYITSKEAGWPSDAERRNIIVRSVRSAIGLTLALSSLTLFMWERNSPGSIVDGLTLINTTRVLVLCVLPLFVLLLVGSVIQYSVWGKTEAAMKDKVRRIIEEKRRQKGQDKQP